MQFKMNDLDNGKRFCLNSTKATSFKSFDSLLNAISYTKNGININEFLVLWVNHIIVHIPVVWIFWEFRNEEKFPLFIKMILQFILDYYYYYWSAIWNVWPNQIKILIILMNTLYIYNVIYNRCCCFSGFNK